MGASFKLAQSMAVPENPGVPYQSKAMGNMTTGGTAMRTASAPPPAPVPGVQKVEMIGTAVVPGTLTVQTLVF